MGHYVPNVPKQQSDLIKEIQDMKNLIKNIKEGNNKSTYSFQEIYPYPYDLITSVAQYPLGFEMPKFKKYKGEGEPRHHVQEFFVSFQEVSYSDI